MNIQLFLDKNTNDLLTYEEAIEREKKYLIEFIPFEEWLHEYWEPDEVYQFFIEQDDIDQAKNELQKIYVERMQNKAKDRIFDPCGWKVYTVDI